MEDLLGRLYDADFSEACFEPFMKELGRRMHSHVLALHTHDVTHGHTTIVNGVGVDAQLQACWDQVANDNVWFQRGAAQLLSEGTSDDSQLTTPGELHRTRFHADFLRVADLEHGMAMFLGTDTDESLVVLSVNRSARHGCYDDAERRLARALLPHVRNAYALHSRMRGLQGLEHAYRSTLDRLEQPLLLVSATGRIMFANESARRLEASGCCLHIRQGAPVATQPADDARLHSAVARVVSGATCGGSVALPLHDHTGAISAMLTICPTPPPVFADLCSRSVAAAIFVRPLQPRTLPDDVRAAFGLTVAEFRLARLLVAGTSLDDASRSLGISKNTARTQLRGLFDKTGTHRQSELVALLHRAS
jgi:DNA-binding CsgD family transcriptional regulator/PAS domain-containing protein